MKNFKGLATLSNYDFFSLVANITKGVCYGITTVTQQQFEMIQQEAQTRQKAAQLPTRPVMIAHDIANDLLVALEQLVRCPETVSDVFIERTMEEAKEVCQFFSE